MTSAVPIVNLGLKYVNGLEITRTGNAALAMAAGQCRDSTNVYDIVVPSALAVSGATVGSAGGLDTGTFAASKMYAVFVIFDPTYTNAPAMLLSLSATAPVLPSGYSVFRVIGYWGTTGATAFYVGDWNGNGNIRTFYYDALLATPVTAGAQTSFTAIDLSNLVPAINNLQVNFYMNFNANAAADTAAFRPTGSSSTNGQHIMTAQVAGATAHLDQKVMLLTKLAAGLPEIDYKVSAGAIAVSLEGYVLNLN